MLDLKLLRDQSARDALKTTLATRGYDLDVDFWVDVETRRKVLQVQTETLQAQKNAGAKQIGEKKRNGENADELLAQMGEISTQMKASEEALRALQDEINGALLSIPNIPQSDVPQGDNEEDNLEIRRVGIPKTFDFTPLDHTDLGEKMAGLDFALAAKLTGSRFSVLTGELAALNRALVQFMLTEHLAAGYLEYYVPYMVNRESLQGTGQLPKFEEDLFKVGDKDYYLIPTSEVPLTNTVRDTILTTDALPLKLTAHTPCFRSEAGSAGRDTRGLIRQHQFEKVEMVQICTPEQSAAALEAMVAQAERILVALELPYRVMLLCTGDMGFSAQKTYDLEVWLPSQNTYREISSCSNCGDFQARRMAARFRASDAAKNVATQFVHTLNGSGLAVGRTLLAILENHQNADGSVNIPKALQPFMSGKTVIGADQ